MPWNRGNRTPINPERIGKLSALGLSEHQARAYLALLDVDSSNVNELAKTSRVPRVKLYEVLLSLNRKGLVDILPETPQRFRANPITALYDNRVEELRSEEAQLKRTIGELALQFAAQSRDRKTEQERDFLSLAHGRTQYLAALRQLLPRTQTSLLILGDKLFLARLRVYDELLPALTELAARATVRILIPQNTVDVVEGRRIVLDELEPAIRRGELRVDDAAIWIRDREEYVQCRFVPNDLHPSQGSDRVVLGRDPEMANALHRLVDAAWTNARTPLKKTLGPSA